MLYSERGQKVSIPKKQRRVKIVFKSLISPQWQQRQPNKKSQSPKQSFLLIFPESRKKKEIEHLKVIGDTHLTWKNIHQPNPKSPGRIRMQKALPYDNTLHTYWRREHDLLVLSDMKQIVCVELVNNNCPDKNLYLRGSSYLLEIVGNSHIVLGGLEGPCTKYVSTIYLQLKIFTVYTRSSSSKSL